MAETALTPVTPKGPYVASVAADALDAVWTAGDVANGNKVALTGREILAVQNSHATNAYTFTMTGAQDPFKRSQTIGPYSLAAGEIAFFSLIGGQVGWQNASGDLILAVENAAVKFCVLRV